MQTILTDPATDALAQMPQHSRQRVRELAERHRLADPDRRKSLPIMAERHIRAAIEDYQREGEESELRCAMCRTEIVTAELCAECAEGNDPFFQCKYNFPKEYS